MQSQRLSSRPATARTGDRDVYLSPFTNTTNPYIDLQKALLHDLGFEARPFSLRALLRGGFRQLEKEPVVALHWLETRLFRRSGAGVSWSWTGAAEFAAYLTLIKTLRCRSVYFVHNHAIHDGSPWQRALSKRVVRLLCKLASERVVHDPSYCEEYDATFLPHPVYWDAPGPRQELGSPDARPAGPAARVNEHAAPSHAPVRGPVRFGIIGALRPYKRIEDVLHHWPEQAPLSVRGRGDERYVDQLKTIVAERQLQDVSIVNRFLSEAELAHEVECCDVMVLPQMTGSMLVSGAFFEAVGVTRAVIMRETPFARWCSQQLGGVWTFRTPDEIPEVVRQVTAALAEAPNADAKEDARRLFGWQTCLASYGAFWQRLFDDDTESATHAAVSLDAPDAAEQAAAQ